MKHTIKLDKNATNIQVWRGPDGDELFDRADFRIRELKSCKMLEFDACFGYVFRVVAGRNVTYYFSSCKDRCFSRPKLVEVSREWALKYSGAKIKYIGKNSTSAHKIYFHKLLEIDLFACATLAYTNCLTKWLWTLPQETQNKLERLYYRA